MGASQPLGGVLMTREGEEVWESNIDGTVWVEVSDGRGGVRDLSVRGQGRLRILTEDRIIVQERCQNASNDPFRNGMLSRLDADQQADPKTASVDALSGEDLLKLFTLTGEAFEAAVEGLGELTVRRMKDVAEAVDATSSQVKLLDETIVRKWPIGGDTPTYREMENMGDVAVQRGVG